VVLINLPDMAYAPIVASLPRALYERRIEAFNDHVEATAARHGFAWVDLYSHSRLVLPGHPEYFCADGFHPSAEGYEEWATFLTPQIARVLEPLRAAGT
jgi:acyl-CoA thioesterase I